MPAARPSQAAVERAIRAAAKLGLVPRALHVPPDGTVRPLFEEPPTVAPSLEGDGAEAW